MNPLSRVLLFLAIYLVACDQIVPPPTPYGPVPSERQLKWHELEIIGMVNFLLLLTMAKSGDMEMKIRLSSILLNSMPYRLSEPPGQVA